MQEEWGVRDLKEQIMDRVERDRPEFNKCYLEKMAQRPQLAVSVEFTAKVDRGRKVSDLNFLTSSIENRSMPGCEIHLRGTLRRDDDLGRYFYDYDWDSQGAGGQSNEDLLTVRAIDGLPSDEEILRDKSSFDSKKVSTPGI